MTGLDTRPLQWRADPFMRLSHIKRNRATRAEVQGRREHLLGIVASLRPMTVRQVFYQASIRGLVEKSESGYAKVQTDLVAMRRAGALSYGWLADTTRWERKPWSFLDPADALEQWASMYRKSLWADAESYVEVWLEKDALSGTIFPVTERNDVPLMVSRGYASLTFLHSSAEHIKTVGVPTYLYHLGDFDPSGVNAAQKIESTLREMAPGAEIHFQRIAVTLDQIHQLELPTRPTKTTDTRSRWFGDISVELDAMSPDYLRGLVAAAIEIHLPPRQLALLKIAEESEKQGLLALARREAA
jgi:hypothetical protein